MQSSDTMMRMVYANPKLTVELLQQPSLSLLPAQDFLTKNKGLLRRGEDELLVVTLQLKYDRDARRDMAEVCLLRHGARQWELTEPVPIVEDEGKGHRGRCGPGTVIPVGDRFLCWVEYGGGFFLCDMADEESPKVRSTCVRSRYAFTINTWTLNLSMDELLTWVKDGEIDCEELWGLPGYEGLPRANVQCPVVCLDNPDVVCFLVSNYDISRREDGTRWMIQFNVKTKTLQSVIKFTGDPWRAYHHLPAKLQC
ncbi:hypothetical protein BAE44_0001299 [Dichanthelium oligosanthes]|uniref:DUF1618 domain-containing protein n=1 Tax=Dichanthelium oligosanthes TaxID=888268 RepID=A0A1E5WJV4_9POAL|nr:hypothetical protein BAE44_0001299 [Dichanthelium oligosanthes]